MALQLGCYLIHLANPGVMKAEYRTIKKAPAGTDLRLAWGLSVYYSMLHKDAMAFAAPLHRVSVYALDAFLIVAV